MLWSQHRHSPLDNLRYPSDTASITVLYVVPRHPEDSYLGGGGPGFLLEAVKSPALSYNITGPTWRGIGNGQIAVTRIESSPGAVGD